MYGLISADRARLGVRVVQLDRTASRYHRKWTVKIKNEISDLIAIMYVSMEPCWDLQLDINPEAMRPCGE